MVAADTTAAQGLRTDTETVSVTVIGSRSATSESFGASVIEIGSLIIGSVTLPEGGASVPEPLPVPLSIIVCVKFAPDGTLGGLLKAALSVNVMAPLAAAPA